MQTVVVYKDSALPPGLAAFVVFGALIVLSISVVVCFLRAHHRRVLAAAAEATMRDTVPHLVAGADVVLGGVVRHLEAHDVAVKVKITQEGSEAESSGSWSHAWTEIDREIILAPFLLELADGQLVRVDPPKQVDVADTLDQKVWIDRNHRVLSAELVPGEKIYARGRIERSDTAVASNALYRDVQWGWALRAAGGQMLLSSEPLGEGMKQRASFHHHFGIVAIVALAFTQLTLIPYYGRATGDTIQIPVEGKRYYQTSDGDGTYDHYTLDLAMPAAGAVEIDSDDYGRVSEGDVVFVRIADSTGNWNLGDRATISVFHGAILAGSAIGFWLWYAGRRRATRPWFRRKVNEKGGGRLPDP